MLSATLVREQKKPAFSLIQTEGKKETMSLLGFCHYLLQKVRKKPKIVTVKEKQTNKQQNLREGMRR